MVDSMTFIADAGASSSEWDNNSTSYDAWGRPKTYTDLSLLHATWTYDLVRANWKVDEGAGWILDNATPTNVTSTNGRLVVNAGAILNDASMMQSRRSPKYQPNRGHLYSTALCLPNPTDAGERDFGLFNAEEGVFFRLKTDGNLYACIKRNSVVIKEELITLPATIDLAMGNLFDIQYQWRGVGNYKFMVGDPATGKLINSHTITFLNTLTEELSIRNPALPVCYKSTNLGNNVKISVGCCDITSEGGGRQNRLYGSVSTPQIGYALPSAGNEAVLAIKMN